MDILDELSEIPALVAAPGGAVLASAGGSCADVGMEYAQARFRSGNAMVAHAAFVAGRLKIAPGKPLFNVLELFAFVRPGIPCVPSPLGLARALGLAVPSGLVEQALVLRDAAGALLGELAAKTDAEKTQLRPLVQMLLRSGWRWAPTITARIGEPDAANSPIAGLDVWRTLIEWEDEAPPTKPGSLPVAEDETRRRLAQLVGTGGEPRPEQVAYAEASTYAFGPRERPGAPRIALIEAGTGIGKTLGYLAPASLWAEKNGPGLWLSTYTRNLQRQLVQELARLYPDPAEREDKAVVRKGRENYVCLLNFEEAVKRTALAPGQRSVVLALFARWIAATRDGDISGAGFPAFLAATFPMSEITDRRGECIYSACGHYRTCFVERVIRRSRHAPIVIANHALVIAQATRDWRSSDEDGQTPERRIRYVFDEGHHLFDAADSGFAAHLSGSEMADLRRWLRGHEGRARSRMRGLEERLKDLVANDPVAQSTVGEALSAAGALAGGGWTSRISAAAARGPGEIFLGEIWQHVQARSSDRDAFYSLEADTASLAPPLLEAARRLGGALKRIAAPLMALSYTLRKRLDSEAGKLDSHTRMRIEAAARGIDRRAKLVLPAWIAMLDALDPLCDSGAVDREFVDWFEIEREDGRDVDVGLRRHWIDPTIPLTSEVLAPSHGALITSATLRDAQSAQGDWHSAEVRTGALHLPEPPRRASFGSPFKYEEQVRIFVVRDMPRRDPAALAAAYRELFLAAGGGALGLFTSVRMLRAVEGRIAAPLAQAGLTLYAQHVDRLDTGALVDLFRAEENACLLGTDALRDGVDVPGRSLRLVVFDKVPWPKPTILHKARRERFGKSYDDLLTRLKLKQAFGRLIRSRTDKGCFVILEAATPSRLLTALPPAAPVRRCGLAQAVTEIRSFLSGTDENLPPDTGNAESRKV
ncbi:MAG TPA: ATP-dependent DNA helicase [Rhizomicrobium sp.]